MIHHRPYLGSSDVPAVLGLSGFRGAFAVWARVTGAVVPTDHTDDIKELGNIVEPGLLAWYANTRRVKVYRGPPVSAPPIRGTDRFIGVHHDGYAVEEQAVVEAKVITLFDDEWGEDGSQDARADYLVQTQIQCAVLARAGWPVRRGVIVAISRYTGERRCFRFERDPEEEEELLDTLRLWWDRHVVGWEPPPLDDSPEARAYSLGRFNPADKTSRPATPHEERLIRRYIDIGQRVKVLSSERRTLATDLLGRMNAREITLPSGVRALRTSNGQLRTYGTEE